MTETLRVLALLEGIGLVALPLAARALGRLPGAGVAFAKPLGLLLLTWLVWFVGSLGVPNGPVLAVGGAVLLAIAGIVAWRTAPRDQRRDPFRERLFVASEILFAVAFLGGALYMAFSPDVWGTEKPMDMALTNATIVSESYPPHDPWLSGEQLNYYYLGQLAAGLLIRLTDVEPTAGYNLAMAAVFALAATAAFGLAATVAEAGRRRGLAIRRPLLAGGAATFLLLLMGNLRGGWEAVQHAGSWLDFDWFAQSRVIEDTINEFPFFSFLVGDLHAHVIAVPLSLLALAFVAQVWLEGPPRLHRVGELFCAALAVGILYAVNSWSWPVIAGLLLLAGLSWGRHALPWTLTAIGFGLVLIMPFLVEFDPNARGLGIVETREGLGDFLVHNGVIYGALAWIVAALYVARLRRSAHPWRGLIWGTAIAVVVMTLLATADLAGGAAVALLAVVALHAALRSPFDRAERLVWLLVSGALTCIALPEVIYVRDEFDGSEFVRMNTVFKMGYQAWILFAIAGGVVVAAGSTWLPRLPRYVWYGGALVAVAISFWFVPVASESRKRGFQDGPRLDGREWLAATAPGDPPAIDWLRTNTEGDAVVLEAVGDDYSPFGNARVSTYTGRPTVLGWQGHELQWSHDVGTRRQDVETLYSTTNETLARELLADYRVEYAVIGPLERTTYGAPGVLDDLGLLVFERDGTAVYEYELRRPTGVPPGETPEPPVLGG